MTRRDLLALGAITAPALRAKKHFDKTRLSAITDEIGKTSADAIEFAKQYNLQWVELRSVPETRKEYAFLPEPELKAAAASFANAGLKVSFLNSSMLKFGWPGTEPVRRREETEEKRAQRLAGEAKRFENRMQDLKRAIHAAHVLGVHKIRVFTGSRVADPASIYPRIADILGEMAFVAEKEKVNLLVENEGSCNVGTSSELAAIAKLLPSKAIGINWDPQNVLGLKEVPFPDGYALLPKKRLMNVQIKGKGVMEGPQKLDWAAIIHALEKDGYKGKVGLETHIFDGTLIQASHTSIREILRIVS